MMIENYADAVISKKMLKHRGHEVNLITFGSDDSNVSLVCDKCQTVILDYEFDGSDEEKELMKD